MLPKMTKFICNSVKINYSFIKNSHAHFQYVYSRYAMFQKDPLKTVGRVDYTNPIPYSVTNGRTDGLRDGRTDRGKSQCPLTIVTVA